MTDDIEWDESQIEQEEEDTYHELFQNHDLDDDSCNSDDDDDVKDDNKNDGSVLGRIGIRKRKQKWTHLKQTKHNVTVTIGETQESVWKQAQMEIKRLRKMLVERTGTKNPTIHQIINLLYGNEGRVYLIFKEKLKWSYTMFCQFLATISFQLALNLSTKDLYSGSTDRLDTRDLLSEKDYRKAWNDIGILGQPSELEGANNTKSGRVYF